MIELGSEYYKLSPFFEVTSGKYTLFYRMMFVPISIAFYLAAFQKNETIELRLFKEFSYFIFQPTGK